MNKVFKSYEEYFAAKNPGAKRAAAEGDPLERFYLTGWWWSGEIVEFPDGRALPTTLHIDSKILARDRARDGWVPVQFVPDDVLDLLVKYHGGLDKLPRALTDQMPDRIAERSTKSASKK